MPEGCAVRENRSLEGLVDDFGPIMVIASITITDEQQFEGMRLPVSQIAVELHAPISGGRFAHQDVKVSGMQDYSPMNTD